MVTMVMCRVLVTVANRRLSAPLSFPEAAQRLHSWPGPCLGVASRPGHLNHELTRSVRRPPPGRVARSIAAPRSARGGGVESPPPASSAASAPAHISPTTCEEVTAGRLVWEVDSGSRAGSGVAAPWAAPWVRGGIAHRPVLGCLELGHAHSFDMRHARPVSKLYAAVQTCQGTAGTEISSRER